ncbi:hypothetical protein FHR78_001009 [Frigoribacterium faeni]|nr:hypothetical protein [Frigoribacterium faeni]
MAEFFIGLVSAITLVGLVLTVAAFAALSTSK